MVSEAKPGGLFILAPCGRPLQASQGAAAMQSIEIILLSILMVRENNVFFYMLLEKSLVMLLSDIKSVFFTEILRMGFHRHKSLRIIEL